MKIEEYATQEEIKAHELLVELTNTCRKLPPMHCSESTEMQTAIHSIQQLLGLRILRRVFPDTYPTYSKKEDKENK